MRVKERLEALARQAARRPVLTVGIVLALAIAGGLLALGLRPSAATDTFVSRSSATFQATNQDYRNFGGDAVVILIREPLANLVQSADLGVVSELEACFAGQVLVPSQQLSALEPAPAGALQAYGGKNSPCGKLMRAKAVQVVYGPGTFLNRAVAAVNTGIVQLEKSASQTVAAAGNQAYRNAIAAHQSRASALKTDQAAQQAAQSQQTQQLEQMALQSGISLSSFPVAIDNKSFISQVVFDQSRGVDQPKGRFAYVFPTANSALIQVRLKSNLSTTQQAHVISLIRQAVKLPMFRLKNGGSYTVSGEPVVVNDLANQISHSIVVLLIAALLVMAAMLLIVFRSRLRLLPLAIALIAAGITFGITAIAGATLTMASIAVLPILIGLAVDYAIQFQSRAQEARRANEGASAEAAVAGAAAQGAPTIAAAALATATGFLVLLLSPVPMVRGFGLLLVLGIAISLVCALSAGSAALVLADRDGGAIGASLRGAVEILGDAARGAGMILRGAGRRLPRPPRPRLRRPRRRATSGGPSRGSLSAVPGSVLGAVVRRPGRVVAVGAVLAVLGVVADTQTGVQSDVTKLVPSSMPALRNLRLLERVTGVSGEIDVTVHSSDVATAKTVGWMIRYENGLLRHFGYLETAGCSRSTLCPALSLPDLFSTSGQSSSSSLTDASIKDLLSAVPPYFKQAVITANGQNATLAFGIRLMPLAKQQRVIDYMRSQLHPPTGVTAQLAGLPVLAAQANAALSSSGRRLLTLLAGLAAVGLVLLAVFRRPRRALVPLIPIALATGWSALILFVIGIPLNPMSATLGALVLAISTEFSVLLSERFGQERGGAADLRDALARTYRSTGAAVLASGITAIAGFGVLVFSNITMLRDFGFVTVIDLTVSLLGVLLVLPAVLVLSEREGIAQSPIRALRRASAAAPRPRRRTRVA
jgi:hydrophobe/amphiphile efflux-3 (HAE3) family protein